MSPSPSPSAAAGWWPSCAPTATTTTSTRPWPCATPVDAPVLLHPDDRMLWDAVHAGHAPDRDLEPGSVLAAGGHELGVIHTPGHSPGCCCFHDGADGRVLSGDTLFCGGPGATGRSYSDEPTILRSIRDRLLSLPPDTVVHTGHGDNTTIGAEAERVLDRMSELRLA